MACGTRRRGFPEARATSPAIDAVLKESVPFSHFVAAGTSWREIGAQSQLIGVQIQVSIHSIGYGNVAGVSNDCGPLGRTATPLCIGTISLS